MSSPIKTFNIIETIQENHPIGVTEIAEVTELPKSTVHAHLSTLKDLDYVTQRGNKYELGLRFLDHGIRSLEKLKIYHISNDTMKQIAEQTGEMIWLVVEEHGRGVYVKKSRGEAGVMTHSRLGRRPHLHYLAAGKAILSQLAEERVQEIIDRHGLPEINENTITNPSELFEELEIIRSKQGIAFNKGEETKGMRAVGAPIVHDNVVYGALSIAGPGRRMTEDRFHEELPEILRGASNEIELKLAYEENRSSNSNIPSYL